MGEILSNYDDFKNSNESIDQETPSGSRRANRKKSKNRKSAFNKKINSDLTAKASAKAGAVSSKVSESMGPRLTAIKAKLKEVMVRYMM